MIMTTARQTKVNILILYKPLRKKKKSVPYFFPDQCPKSGTSLFF